MRTAHAGAWYSLSIPQFTVAVKVNEDKVICDAPPIARKFVGQPFRNLHAWMFKRAPEFGVSVSRLDRDLPTA